MDTEIDRTLERARSGDSEAASELATAVYADFRRLARHFLQRERPDHTLQPTALANEVYLRLFDAPFPDFSSRAEFFVAAARTIRRILVEHARARNTQKRGGAAIRIDLDAVPLPSELPRDERLVSLDTALLKLAEMDPEKARLVELRFFGGFSVAEVARLTDSSERTVARAWRTARAFLESQMRTADESADATSMAARRSRDT